MPWRALDRNGRSAAWPACRRFQPETPVSSEEIQLTVEEYETLRLMDLEGYTQAECAQTMGIARTTVQSIYASARRKVSRMLVEGRPLVIGRGSLPALSGMVGPMPLRRMRAAQGPACVSCVTGKEGFGYAYCSHL